MQLFIAQFSLFSYYSHSLILKYSLQHTGRVEVEAKLDLDEMLFLKSSETN
jgi:hypothetical protein